jgi:branched-subunit amino acid aminotransferase/4-amino-4-deoxychorismate lyase
MHKYLSFNDKISLASEIYLPAISSAAFYGRGIFTTIAIYNSAPFQWNKHWRRLVENAKTVGVDLSELAEENVKKSLAEIIRQNNLKNGRARLTFFDTSSKKIWQTENKLSTAVLITAADFRTVPDKLSLTVSPYQINSKSPLAGVKSSNYLENILVLEEAGKLGFDEAIRLNEKGKIASAAMANVFWVRSGEIFTPALEAGALRGTTREFVLQNFSVYEEQFEIDELENADEILLTSAGIGIAQVKNLEEKNLEDSNVFTKVRKLFEEFTGQATESLI